VIFRILLQGNTANLCGACHAPINDAAVHDDAALRPQQDKASPTFNSGNIRPFLGDRLL